MFIITEKSEPFKRYLNMGLTELDTKCSPPFSPSAFASTKLTKNDTKHIPKISDRLSVNNVLARSWSTFRQMQTLDKVTNFSLNHDIKMYLLFCSLGLVFKAGGWTFSLIASIQVSSLHIEFLNCFQ